MSDQGEEYYWLCGRLETPHEISIARNPIWTSARTTAICQIEKGTPMKLRRRQFLHLAACGAALPAVSRIARAQDYPTRPVRFIVPFPPGGATDAAARFIAEPMSQTLGQQVYVENKPGASGSIGIEAAAKSTPDGYTVLISPDAVMTNPHIYKINIDTLKDLIPVIQLSRQPYVLAVHPSLGVNSLAELIALAKQQPGLRYAGVGLNAQHMAVQWFARLAGVSFELVPYRGGGEAIIDMVAGHVKIGVLDSTPLIPHYRAGSLRLLAQTMGTRSRGLPDVPTFQEAGIDGLVINQWMGVFVPAGTPAAIVARLNDEIGKALADPAVRQRFLEADQEPVGGSSAQFAQFAQAEYEKYGRLAKALNIKAE
jgi:tripartite-type tricarboxylate transporter receptor subunit TctC